MHTWQEWKHFLFGTPKRLTITVLTITFIGILLTPGALVRLVDRIIQEILVPLGGLAVIILIVVYAYKRILGGVGLGGGKKRH